MDITCKTCCAIMASDASKCPECGQPSEMHATTVAQRVSNVPLATDRQKEFARSLGIEFSADIDRQQISKLIAVATKKRDDESVAGIENQSLVDQMESMTPHAPTNSWPVGMFKSLKADSMANQALANTDPQPVGRTKRELAKVKVTLPASLRKLTGESRRIVVERPYGWEQLLFCEVMESKLSELAFEKRDAELGINFDKKPKHVSLIKFPSWISSMMKDFSESLVLTETLLGPEFFEKAFGPPGTPGDAEEIVYLADRLVRVYRDSISRSQLIRGCISHEVFDRVKVIAANVMLSTTAEIENFVTSFRSELDAWINDPPKEGESRSVTVVFCSVPKCDEFFAEMDRLIPTVMTLATGEE